jgi:hypothetical protein
LETLTQFELWELWYMARDSASYDSSVLFTLLSAYLIVAFLVAKRLSRFQVLSITAIYTAMFGYTSVGFHYTYSVVLGVGAQWSVPAPLWNYGIYVVFCGAWLLSIIFMVQARRGGET